MERCLYIGNTSGEKVFSRNVARNVRRICRERGAMSLTGYPARRWEHGRYADPYMREDLNDYGILIDTLESGVTWGNLHRLHRGVRELIKSRPNIIPTSGAITIYGTTFNKPPSFNAANPACATAAPANPPTRACEETNCLIPWAYSRRSNSPTLDHVDAY
jgi:hypothetical protein